MSTRRVAVTLVLDDDEQVDELDVPAHASAVEVGALVNAYIADRFQWWWRDLEEPAHG